MDRSPDILVSWEPRWRGFLSAVPVAISRSAPRIGVEGSRPQLARGIAGSVLLHILIVGAACLLWQQDLARRPELVPALSLFDTTVIYFQEKLPEIGDKEGAPEGVKGSAGGQMTFDTRQVIRVAHGERTARIVAYASPSIRLPLSKADLANLLILNRQLPIAPEAPLRVRTKGSASKRFPETREEAPILDIAALPVEQPKLAAPVVPKFVPKVETISSDIGNVLRVPPSPLQSESAETLSVAGANQIPGSEQTEAVVISVHHGSQVGFPGEMAGAIVASPRGTNELGMGSGSSGLGTSAGGGPGSGKLGVGTGSGVAGAGPGADPHATSGITPGTGGGTGGNTIGSKRGGGISIQNGVVMIPSFGGNDQGASQTSMMPRMNPSSVIVVAGTRAGGGMSDYGVLKGSTVYTTYVQTKLGTVVLQYSETPKKGSGFDQVLNAPEPIRVELPNESKGMRFVVFCLLGKSGTLQDIRFLEAPEPAITQIIRSALANWRFMPATRGTEKVEVQALLGFHIGTR